MQNHHDKMFYKIILAFILGISLGFLKPEWTEPLQMIATVFVKCIKMVVTPIIFFSLITGICAHSADGHHDAKGFRRLFVKTLVYFEVMSLVAILITFGVMLVFVPGATLDPSSLPHLDISHFVAKAQSQSFKSFFLNIIPDSFLGALAHDNLLSVIFLSVLTSIAILQIKKRAKILVFMEEANHLFFQIIRVIIRFSPYATFSAIAFAVGHAGLATLLSLGQLFMAVLVSMALFCVLIGLIGSLYYQIPILKLIRHIKQEFMLSYATSSTESVFPQMLNKLESFGCSKKVVSFVLPMGYSFNLDGTAIYVTAGALFLQQAYQIHFGLRDYLTLFVILLFTSKGAAGVAGAGFITLSATLASMPETPIPFEGLGILLGVDRFMSDARTVSNLFGNAVGTLIIGASEGAFKVPDQMPVDPHQIHISKVSSNSTSIGENLVS